MNAEIRIIGAISNPIASGTAKRSTAKAVMRPRAMPIFLDQLLAARQIPKPT
jgi:hypothetical protein